MEGLGGCSRKDGMGRLGSALWRGSCGGCEAALLNRVVAGGGGYGLHGVAGASGGL